jgi:choline dehydrogenase-like flavoprotein
MDDARAARPALSGDDVLALHEKMLATAESPDSTPFDYIVVGSGAGGGPLAARLAEAGKTVLVLEAGGDPAAQGPNDGIIRVDSEQKPTAREVYEVPGYHAAATEDPQMAWMFSVRHYEDDAAQQRDSKYSRAQDPLRTPGEPWKGGIQYPRASALGGCTAHHAMIVKAFCARCSSSTRGCAAWPPSSIPAGSSIVAAMERAAGRRRASSIRG